MALLWLQFHNSRKNSVASQCILNTLFPCVKLTFENVTLEVTRTMSPVKETSKRIWGLENFSQTFLITLNGIFSTSRTQVSSSIQITFVSSKPVTSTSPAINRMNGNKKMTHLWHTLISWPSPPGWGLCCHRIQSDKRKEKVIRNFAATFLWNLSLPDAKYERFA